MKVAFYKNKRGGVAGFFDWLIRTVTRGPYSHCELIFSDGMAFSSSIQDGGTRFKAIQFDPEKWDVLLIAVDEAIVRAFCEREKGCGYDFPGAFRFLVPFLGESKDKWFCSEVCCAALQAGGLILGVNAWQVHPGKLYELLTVV